MDRAKLKTYAPQARLDFIQAMKARAALFGITDKGTALAIMQGDLALIQGKAYPKSTEALRQRLTKQIQTDGFEHVMEAMAHTWFNRFAALRYMELNGYLDHGYRVLSSPEGRTTPEILEQAEYVDLPALRREHVVDLKVEGKEQELYRLLLVAQCNGLHEAMPFLFEAIEDETELLLPDNLLHSDSLIRKLVANLDADDCESVEVLGWLYQFYISDKKDTVMARKSAVPTEDIPAVTQLFTPHWIVRYLVENSLGRLWLLNRPTSRLREQMLYYIEGEPEADFLKITKPEEIRLLDPAVGSGHMLTYAFDLLYLIYQEEGYAPAVIPGLILRHNLHGLDLCPRAAQLAGLALVFKAREKSRRFFQAGQLVQPNIIELRDVSFADNELHDYIQALGLGNLFSHPLVKLLHQFEEAKSFGSLIQPCLDEQGIAYARNAIEATGLGDQIFLRETHLKVLRVLEQAEALTQRYCIVVANPPYMGNAQMTPAVKDFVKENFPDSKADLFAVFIERGLTLALPNGFAGLITMQSWMFLTSFEKLRESLVANKTLISMAHLGPRGFDSISGEVVQTTAFVVLNAAYPQYRGTFIRLVDGESELAKASSAQEAIHNPGCGWIFRMQADEFRKIPGSPIAYWLSHNMRIIFSENSTLAGLAEARRGVETGDNNRFLRNWHEVERPKIGIGCQCSSSEITWYPYNKGGGFKRWFGNRSIVINWQDNGRDVKNQKYPAGSRLPWRAANDDWYFRTGITWGGITSGPVTFRLSDYGAIFDSKGAMVFPVAEISPIILGLLNTVLVEKILKILNPSLNTQKEDINNIPIIDLSKISNDPITKIVSECLSLSKLDECAFETSWDFSIHPLLRSDLKGTTIKTSWQNWEKCCTDAVSRMQELETENNRFFISAYGLEDELQPEVPDDQITLARADASKDTAALLSYTIGCMMGRFSLNKPGLIYAQAGNVDFDASQYVTFPADEDGILPVTEFAWFPDDAAIRFEAFVRTVWPPENLEENLTWVAESLDTKNDETTREMIRRYFATCLYKDHLQTYKKRPIYWLFSSGKERAFQALVYLHRYNEDTLARMRTEYAIPLQGRISGRMEQLSEDIAHATSAAHGKKLQKELDTLRKQQVELHIFEEKLHHYADLRISLDLDDGVKVNYAKFGDLLAEVKAVTGGKDEE